MMKLLIYAIIAAAILSAIFDTDKKKEEAIEQLQERVDDAQERLDSVVKRSLTTEPTPPPSSGGLMSK